MMEPQILISKTALLHNLALVRQRCGNTKIIAVIKADAYGHSMLDIARILSQKVHLFAVSTLEEALFLRKNGIEDEVLILQGFCDAQELYEIASNHFHATVFCNHQLELIKKFINSNQTKAKPLFQPWLKVNTGMCRLGMEPENLSSYLGFLQELGYQNIRIMSHMSCQDTPAHQLNQIQITRFNDIIQDYEGYECSLFNSSAPFCTRERLFHYVRIGIALYGISPLLHKTSVELNLRPVMRFYGKIISIDERKCGEYIGYCATHQLVSDVYHDTPHNTTNTQRIATVAVGYSHGYPQVHCGYVLLHKSRCKVIGKVSMNMLNIDVSHITDVGVGMQVCLWGENELLVEHVEQFSAQSRWAIVTQANARITVTE